MPAMRLNPSPAPTSTNADSDYRSRLASTFCDRRAAIYGERAPSYICSDNVSGMDDLPEDFLPRLNQLREPAAFVELIHRLLTRQEQLDVWDAAELGQEPARATDPERRRAEADAWAALDADTQRRLSEFVYGPPAVPAVVAYRHERRLRARQALIDDPIAARETAVREHERDLEELRAALEAANLPFIEDLAPFLMRGLIRIRRAKADRRWHPPAPIFP